MGLPIRMLLVVAIWGGLALFVWMLWRRFVDRADAYRRLAFYTNASPGDVDEGDRRGWLARQMSLAGFDAPGAGLFLIGLSISALLGGIAMAFLFRRSGLQQLVLEGVEAAPGGLSGMMAPVVIVSPWLMAVMIALLPVLYVRSSRRRRVAQVTRDLPLALDLWAALSEGGLGFDAALDRWQKTQHEERVLATACRGFQRDLLGGMRRSDAYRRLSARLEVSGLTRFTAAMIQSEQMGSSVSETLRLQAEDVRAERREKSLAFAQSLATKRVIPLVVCFLPGLFVWPLGPFFTQLLRIVDQLTGGGTDF